MRRLTFDLGGQRAAGFRAAISYQWEEQPDNKTDWYVAQGHAGPEAYL